MFTAPHCPDHYWCHCCFTLHIFTSSSSLVFLSIFVTFFLCITIIRVCYLDHDYCLLTFIHHQFVSLDLKVPQHLRFVVSSEVSAILVPGPRVHIWYGCSGTLILLPGDAAPHLPCLANISMVLSVMCCTNPPGASLHLRSCLMWSTPLILRRHD